MDVQTAAERGQLRDQIGVFLPPVHPAGYHRALAAVQAAMPPEAFDAARARLAGLPPAQIVAAAFGPGTTGTGTPPPPTVTGPG